MQSSFIGAQKCVKYSKAVSALSVDVTKISGETIVYAQSKRETGDRVSV